MGVRKRPPIPAELERLQTDYVMELERVLDTYLRLLRGSEGNVTKHRHVRLRADCLRYEYLRLFDDPVRAEEAWIQRLHPLYARAKGYN